LAGEAAECLAALRIAADAARMVDSPGGAPGSRRLDLHHRRSHSNDQHLTVSASRSLSLLLHSEATLGVRPPEKDGVRLGRGAVKLRVSDRDM